MLSICSPSGRGRVGFQTAHWKLHVIELAYQFGQPMRPDLFL
jgi:hypothetical protein